MDMLKLYGTMMSRAARSLWALEELGLKYEQIPLNTQGDSRKPEYLKVNPNGHIPALDDDGFVVWESMAINLYLAEKYGKAPLWPADVRGHAGAYQWSVWAMTEVEPHLITLLRMRLFKQGDEASANAAEEALKAPFKVLNDQLANRPHLLGNDFTIADLNVASVMSWAPMMKLDMSATPKTQEWLTRCLGRESNKRVREKNK
jgi:glutathione S-transferase